MSNVGQKLPLIDLPIGYSPRSLGSLEASAPAEKKVMPLQEVQISAAVADRVASVNVRQVFRNSFSEHLEGVYTFPLSGGCVISSFELRVGDRTVKGIVKERLEARRQYQQALEDGKRAALLEQERDDVFTMQVGNIPPNEEVCVLLTYSEILPYFENGKTELRLPLVVAPRYIAGDALQGYSVGTGTEHDTNLVPDASRITPPRLAPGSQANAKLSIAVDIMHANNGSSIIELSCSQHATQTFSLSGDKSNKITCTRVELSREDERLNRDFVLSWRLATNTVKSSMFLYKDTRGEQFGMLTVVPPKRNGFLGSPRDVLFVLDRSGSMRGIKMTSAARACSLLLHTLGPSDRFAILAFDDRMEWMLPSGASSRSGMFFPADEEHLQKGDVYLRSIGARGGTALDHAIGTALNEVKTSDADQRIPILVVITDGQVGNESGVLKKVQKQIGDARVFTVGVDTAVNTGLLKRLANLGGGTSAFVAPGTDLERALRSISHEIGKAIITDLQITGVDGANIDASDIAPNNLPDLFASRAITAFVKVQGTGSISVRGRWSDGAVFDQRLSMQELNLPSISQMWAKTHILDLEDTFRLNPADSLRRQIVQLSENHSVLTRFTAFVAVDEAEVVNQTGMLHTLAQPVEQPAEWKMTEPLPVSREENLPARPASSLMGQLVRQRRHGDQEAPSLTGTTSGFRNVDQAALKYDAAKLEDQSAAGVPHPATPAPPSPVFDSVQGSSSPSPGSPTPLEAVSYCIHLLAELLQRLFNVIKDGRIPADWQELEQRRKEIVRVLSVSDVGTEVPTLQRFMRVELRELVQSLQHGGSADELLLLWERHLDVFAKAHDELAGNSSVGANKGRFWENSI